MKTYNEIVKELKSAFPKGTFIQKEKGRGHIPVQAYMARLEAVAAEQWHWRIIGVPTINLEQQIVVVIGEITVIDTVRQGMGVGKLNSRETTSIKTALMTAESESFRDACDKFMMGWVDLAPYRDWGKNPGVGLSTETETLENFNPNVHSVMPESGRVCMKCDKALSAEEALILSLNNIKFPYCKEHVPKQLIKIK